MKTALVTGNQGFVGRHLVGRLDRDGWDVTGVDIKTGGAAGDCRRFFAKVDRQFDLVVHLAAVVGGRATIDGEPMKVASDLAIDSDFFGWVLRTRPRRAVYFSSSAAYPTEYQTHDVGLELREDYVDLDHVKQPDAIYGWVKLTGEQLARHANAVGANVQVYRPFSGYGADQDWDYPFPSIINRAAKHDDPFTVWGTGKQVRDWVHIDDVIDLVLRGTDYDEQFGPTNLCTGRPLSIASLAYLAMAFTGYLAELAPVTDAPSGVDYRVGDPTKMKAYLGAPQVSIEDGIVRALRDGRFH